MTAKIHKEPQPCQEVPRLTFPTSTRVESPVPGFPPWQSNTPSQPHTLSGQNFLIRTIFRCPKTKPVPFPLNNCVRLGIHTLREDLTAFPPLMTARLFTYLETICWRHFACPQPHPGNFLKGFTLWRCFTRYALAPKPWHWCWGSYGSALCWHFHPL